MSKVQGSWLGRWRESGKRQVTKLGRVSEMPKTQAKEKLADILRPVNASVHIDTNITFGDLVKDVYFPCCSNIRITRPRVSCTANLNVLFRCECRMHRLGADKRAELECLSSYGPDIELFVKFS